MFAPIMPIRRGPDQWGRWEVWVECHYPNRETFTRSINVEADSMQDAREKVHEVAKRLNLTVTRLH